jgi:hypothetical protein
MFPFLADHRDDRQVGLFGVAVLIKAKISRIQRF